MKIKLAIADDHPVVIDGIRRQLEQVPDIEVLATYRNGSELLEGLQHVKPDVLLIDISMPGKTGDELAQIISECYPDIFMLALTSFDQAFHVHSMLLNGCIGYMLKSSDQEVLLEGIRTVYSGKQFLDPVIKEIILKDTFRKKEEPAQPVLSEREKEILQLIADELTSQEIAEKLFLSLKTVETHRMNLLFKLNVKNSVGLVRKAIDLKLI